MENVIKTNRSANPKKKNTGKQEEELVIGGEKSLVQGIKKFSLETIDFEVRCPGSTTIIKKPRIPTTKVSYLAANLIRVSQAYYIEESIIREVLEANKPPAQKRWTDNRSEEEKAAAEAEFRRQDYYSCQYSRGRTRDFRSPKFRPVTKARGRGGPPIRGSDFRIYRPHTYYRNCPIKITNFREFMKYA